MTEKDFSLRLAKLREEKGVSARDMSLSMGQNPGYINNIESGKSMPSLSGIFYICEYLGISPKDFFDIDAASPSKANELLFSSIVPPVYFPFELVLPVNEGGRV